MALCNTCQKILDSILEGPNSPASDYLDLIYEHSSLLSIQESANSGCCLCKEIVNAFGLECLERASTTAQIQLQHGNSNSLRLLIDSDPLKSYSLPFAAVAPAWWKMIPYPQPGTCGDVSAILKTWITNCVNNHPACSRKEGHFRPTRLLDLEFPNHPQNLSLVETASILANDFSYITLSHCWGKSDKRPAITTHSNLTIRYSCILYEEMPLTFQDAISITRRLGIRFLWIDSLCIIQDSREDWEKESGTMADIYTNSFCTIAASSSPDSHGGCRIAGQESAMTQEIQHLDLEIGLQRIRFNKGPSVRWDIEYDSGPLRMRAWALQERELSHRIIHFAQNVLLWECRTAKACSNLPWKEFHLTDASYYSDKVRNWDMSESTNWWIAIQDYTQRALTFDTDKLPAISGLAHLLTCSNDRYLAGIRESDLPEALLWKTTSSKLGVTAYRPASYRAPSWSWASLNGGVLYTDVLYLSSSHIDRESILSFAITKIVVEAATSDPMGRVSNGHMTIIGRLKRVLLKDLNIDQERCSHTDWEKMSDGWTKILSSENRASVGIITPDILSETYLDTDLNKAVFCLGIKTSASHISDFFSPLHIAPHLSHEDDHDTEVIGLVLSKDVNQSNVYTRIGFMRRMRLSWFKDITPTEITII